MFAEVENIINSRPLTKLSDEVADAEALSPNHLLLMAGNIPSSWRDFGSGDVIRKRWKLVQNLSNAFWERWVREFLPELNSRRKWNSETRNLVPGEVVALHDEQLKSARGMWPLARVLEVFPSSDGLIRKVKLRFRGSEILRPISKLVALELD